MSAIPFQPAQPLFEGTARSECSAVIIVPARDEADALPACLDALAAQADEDGCLLPRSCFEIVLLLNNCSDSSLSVASRWQTMHARTQLHIAQRFLPSAQANAGTARRLLMDTAWHRLSGSRERLQAIVSTDCDTVVHPQWLSRTLQALREGADAVGGLIQLPEDQLSQLPAPVRLAYERDRCYQQLIAELEDLVDPQQGDAWPRHLDHFGASLACTREIYARAGGLPELSSLEDVAFIDALRRIDARVRHDPSVQVFTSSRFSGRAQVGFSNQLRLWHDMVALDQEQRVLSAAFLVHRFITLATLRKFFRRHDHDDIPEAWRERLRREAKRHVAEGQFLAAIDCNALIKDSFQGPSESCIVAAIDDLRELVLRMRPSEVAAQTASQPFE